MALPHTSTRFQTIITLFKHVVYTDKTYGYGCAKVGEAKADVEVRLLKFDDWMKKSYKRSFKLLITNFKIGKLY